MRLQLSFYLFIFSIRLKTIKNDSNHKAFYFIIQLNPSLAGKGFNLYYPKNNTKNKRFVTIIIYRDVNFLQGKDDFWQSG